MACLVDRLVGSVCTCPGVACIARCGTEAPSACVLGGLLWACLQLGLLGCCALGGIAVRSVSPYVLMGLGGLLASAGRDRNHQAGTVFYCIVL